MSSNPDTAPRKSLAHLLHALAVRKAAHAGIGKPAPAAQLVQRLDVAMRQRRHGLRLEIGIGSGIDHRV